MSQENGQRKYGGPPPDWSGPAPSKGCEVFIGKLPRDVFEDELVPIFEKVGKIYELRLMMDFSGGNRGYCFCTYTSKDDAKRAVKELDNYEIRKGRYLGVCASVDNCRLFVGGVLKNKNREEILHEMTKISDDVKDVIVYPSAADKTKNRGFAFVEYESHKAAAYARRKLIPGNVQLFGHKIQVDWAEPENFVDEETMEKVKIIYVRNLMLSTTEEALREYCCNLIGKNSVERVKKLKDYAFIHFYERDDAVKCMTSMNGMDFEGSKVEVTLAKPVSKNDYVRYTRGVGNNPRADAIASPVIGFNPYINIMESQQLNPYTIPIHPAPPTSPIMNGLNRTGVSVARCPLRLNRGRGAAGIKGSSGRSYLYKKPSYTQMLQYYELKPDMVLTPTNPITLRPHPVKSFVQVLEEYLSRSNLGTAQYHLHSAYSGSPNMEQLFVFKVTIPGLQHKMTPDKLFKSVDEAREYAAQYVLMQLGVPQDASFQYLY